MEIECFSKCQNPSAQKTFHLSAMYTCLWCNSQLSKSNIGSCTFFQHNIWQFSFLSFGPPDVWSYLHFLATFCGAFVGRLPADILLLGWVRSQKANFFVDLPAIKPTKNAEVYGLLGSRDCHSRSEPIFKIHGQLLTKSRKRDTAEWFKRRRLWRWRTSRPLSQ